MREGGERSIVAHAAMAALRLLAGFEGRRHQQRPWRHLCRLDHLRAIPAALRRAGQELAACRYLWLDPVGKARATRRRRMPGRARDLQTLERTLWMIRA